MRTRRPGGGGLTSLTTGKVWIGSSTSVPEEILVNQNIIKGILSTGKVWMGNDDGEAVEVGLPTPFVPKGQILENINFPTLAAVINGWFYTIGADVTDNDATKTNTGQSFQTGDEIYWYEGSWVRIQNATKLQTMYRVDYLNNKYGIGTNPPGVGFFVGNILGPVNITTQVYSGMYQTPGASIDSIGLFRYESGILYIRSATNPNKIGDIILSVNNGGPSCTDFIFIKSSMKMGIDINNPTARLHLPAGSAAATTAPAKYTSGPLMTTPEVGAFEFLDDAFYFTITTGAKRCAIMLSDGTITNGKIAYTSNGRIITSEGLSYNGNTLNIDNIISTVADDGLNGAKLGFWGSAVTTKKTLSSYTANDQSVAYEAVGFPTPVEGFEDCININDISTAGGLASLSDVNALREAYETLRSMVEDIRSKIIATTLIEDFTDE